VLSSHRLMRAAYIDAQKIFFFYGAICSVTLKMTRVA